MGRLGVIAAAAAMVLAGCGEKPAGPKGKGSCCGSEKCKGRPPAVAKLLVTLPDYCPTPDGMAIDAQGNIVVACPNYADKDKPVAERRPAVFIKIDPANKVTKWFDCPVMEETGIACPMGIAFGPDGDLYVCDNQNWPTGNGPDGSLNQGRILRLRVAADGSVKTTIVAEGISHPNGVRVHKGKLYVTVSMLPKVKDPDGLLVSAVYTFGLDDEGVKVANTRDDPNLLVEFKTLNRDCQYGMDGIVFDSKGDLFVGNFGDGALHRVTLNADGSVKDSAVFAKTDMKTPMYDPADKTKIQPDFKEMMVRAKMRTTDGICIDADDNIYVADFSNNAVAKVDPKGNITVITQNGDTDGSDGQLDQPGEPVVRGGELVVTCFDMVTGPDKVNTKHDKPYTICTVDLE
jgi:sugar lactone lactonase YvrE